MATISKVGTPSLASVNPEQSDTIVGLAAGETIASGDTCYIKSDGAIWRTNGTAATAPALYDGVYLGPTSVAAGEPMTLHVGVTANYGSGLTPGTRYFVSATAGAIDDAATTGGTVAIAKAITTTKIRFMHPTR